MEAEEEEKNPEYVQTRHNIYGVCKRALRVYKYILKNKNIEDEKKRMYEILKEVE